MGLVKICGLRGVGDALAAVRSGCDELGLNFVPGRTRTIDVTTARAIRAAVTLPLIGIVADADDALLEALEAVGLDAWQLHGSESPARCAELLARGFRVYKAVPVRSQAAVVAADRYPGERVLFDAPVGGSGARFDWRWLAAAGPRPYLLAGGLTPDNVGQAIAQTHAAGVDVASGVETGPAKDPAKLAAFVEKAHEAFAARITLDKPPC